MDPGETSDPDTGSQLGPFRIGRRLGVGGMGIVFQALDTQLNRQVALKIITPHIGENPEFRARFIREAQAQASLDSPHVVQVYSFGEAEGRLYIASQLIPDGDLGQMLHRHGRPPARIAVNLISQVADGLVDAHAAGLVHRDIKPANVLLRKRDHQLQAYLGDFGIARHLGSEAGLTQAGGTVGTPSYMAPELHLGGRAGESTDVYSLGCLLWTTLAGSAPYAGGTDYQVMMAHVEQPVPQLAATGPLAAEINRVLRTAMAKNPGERYPSASAMRDDLRAVVRLPDDATPPRPADAAPGPAPSTWAAPPPRTPTPTPTPSPAPAPPAPPFRPPTPTPAAPFAVAPVAGHGRQGPPAPPRNRRTGWVVAAVLVVLLLVGAGVAVALIVGGDDSAGSGDPDVSDTSETSGTSGTSGSGDRDDQAVAALTEGFASDGTADPAAAGCFARSFVDQYGVDRLVESGVLDDDLAFVAEGSTDSATAEVLLGGVAQATVTCLRELGSPTP